MLEKMNKVNKSFLFRSSVASREGGESSKYPGPSETPSNTGTYLLNYYYGSFSMK